MPTLAEIAQSARADAYAPYSGYHVGAALEDIDGRIFTGVNVENVSYGACICAERTAIVKMVSEGGRQIKRIAVATKDGGTPCGICLQTLLEFTPDPSTMEIVAVNDRFEEQSFTLAQLMPVGFQSAEVLRTE
jgi:cytidine deaminase